MHEGNNVQKWNTYGALRVQLKKQYNIEVSRQTVMRDCRALNARCRSRTLAPQYKVGDEKKRVAACKQFIRIPDLTKMLFSDEKYFDANDYWSQTELCLPGVHPSAKQKSKQNVPKFHVWGCIGVGFKLFKILPQQRMGKELYIDECLKPLRTALKRKKNRIFMQDGATAHTASISKAYIRGMKLDLIEYWPARSPDLNPIEMCWAIAQRALGQFLPETAEELEVAMMKALNDISQTTIDNLVLGFEASVRTCLSNKGGRVTKSTRDAVKKAQSCGGKRKRAQLEK
jgi:transposase